ncbi:MAG TPA: bifunctional phosphopantothenoylcysteine decarboxylase/phosphopantothenate--cysteine ligase CoaBC [Candidatus Kapabacteria bacterium]|nr:bifunctional phosphopantothenoylcysteine decarboxylase/phosphopantothenate--cysteine ligase CoaBC [Candidatus Kapabacteria bacterium]
MIRGKKIIYGITGSVASVKAPIVARELMRAGADVHCVLTQHAEQFTTAYALSVLTKHETITSIFPSHFPNTQHPAPNTSSTWHIDLGRSADAMLIAPCSATTLGKLRFGIYDNAVLLVAASLKEVTPLVLAPAMDEEMWLQPAVQENIEWLRAKGVYVIDPTSGALASGLSGIGRMKEPDEVVKEFENIWQQTKSENIIPDPGHQAPDTNLKGKRILITGGPTYEPIDPVRFIGNRSSGKMGAALANVASQEFGASVTLVIGPSTEKTDGLLHRIDVETTSQMHDAVTQQLPAADIIIMNAAVSDYRVKNYSIAKLKKNGSLNGLTLELEPTEDILKDIASKRSAKQIVVGFALESKERGEEYARKKLAEKSLDMIVLNFYDEAGAGFSSDTNRMTIFKKDGTRSEIALASKTECARAILNEILTIL